MEHIRNPKNWSHYLPNKYEQQLSPFGQKVMAVLFELKHAPNSKSCKSFNPQPQPRYRKKRVIQFNDHNDSKCTFSYKNTTVANTRDVDNTNIHTIANATLISTSSDLFKSPNDYNIKETNIKLNVNKNNSSGEIQIINSLDSNTNNLTKQSNENLLNLGFNQMIDINDIFVCVDDDNIDHSFKNQLDTKEFGLNGIEPENEINDDDKISLKCNTIKKIHPKERVKRKQIINAQCVKEKKIKVNEKTSYRKETYTTVKKWLNDVHLNNEVECGESNELPDNVIRECQKKVPQNKKVIQAQLTNKDGIMKYSKPKEAFENKNKELKVNNFSKGKKAKAKFIAPIKSQIPVKDIEYPIIVISDYFNEFDKQYKDVKNEEIVIMLIFSNGFCQLSQHAEDNCIPEAIIFNVHDTFYYFKSVDPCIIKTFCRFISINTLICYDAKKILLYLYKDLEEDIKVSVIIDTKIGGSLISPDEPPESFSDIQKILSITPDYTVATECVLQRAAWYVTLLRESASKLREMMLENGVYSLFVNIEMKILPIIADMERRGVCVDVPKLKFMEGVLMSRMKEVESECHESAGKPFQINSTLQVRTIIYDELKLDTKCNVKILETVSKGAKSTSETMLRSLSAVHPLPRLILEYRHLHKAYATFVKGVGRHVVNGVVKPTWYIDECTSFHLTVSASRLFSPLGFNEPPDRDQTAAATGRIASNDPNLQATPGTPFHVVPAPRDGETECGPVWLKFRSMYTSRAGHCLLAADFKQLECRLFARAARDRTLQLALDSRDLFTVLAAQWLCKSEGSVCSEERSLTKRVVYASLYGAGARTLGHVLQGTDRQAGEVIESFNRHPTETFPSLKSFGTSVVSECESRGGRLTTPSGRTGTFKNIFSTDFALRSRAERRAVNFIIQGTAADVCKLAMVVTHERLGARARLLLQLHDELVWDVQRRHLHSAAAIIQSAMESCGRELGLDLDLPVAMYCGDNWGEMEEYTPREDDSV